MSKSITQLVTRPAPTTAPYAFSVSVGDTVVLRDASRAVVTGVVFNDTRFKDAPVWLQTSSATGSIRVDYLTLSLNVSDDLQHDKDVVGIVKNTAAVMDTAYNHRTLLEATHKDHNGNLRIITLNAQRESVRIKTSRGIELSMGDYYDLTKMVKVRIATTKAEFVQALDESSRYNYKHTAL